MSKAIEPSESFKEHMMGQIGKGHQPFKKKKKSRANKVQPSRLAMALKGMSDTDEDGD